MKCGWEDDEQDREVCKEQKWINGKQSLPNDITYKLLRGIVHFPLLHG
jgi:hypothetical protein